LPPSEEELTGRDLVLTGVGGRREVTLGELFETVSSASSLLSNNLVRSATETGRSGVTREIEVLTAKYKMMRKMSTIMVHYGKVVKKYQILFQ
jgi:hypothetical protein